jgi:hypothetical protein
MRKRDLKKEMPKKRWFRKAVDAKPPYSLGGWSKNLPPTKRRSLAFQSRKKGTDRARVLSAARALIALANVTKDYPTKAAAKADATHLLVLYKHMKKAGVTKLSDYYKLKRK